ncbi:MAG: UDP-N-acetylglucosamine 1-carboxyvinyltransferase, partial [Actinomycetia bacterium]|nr:UDP-N-acetylglucosamine 1-carboxyvinyltransferase [Actinomycetes bacterium]
MMESRDILIEGGYPISGALRVSGAKNSVLKLMAAAILAPGVTLITNVPMISDVMLMGEVLRQLGVQVEFGANSVRLDTSRLTSFSTPYELVSQMRASITVLGPLLGRYGQAQVSIPGGCNIGNRPIDLHYAALEALGVVFDTESGDILASVPHGLQGVPFRLSFPSVGATENLMMAAVLAQGRTVIDNAACEPEIADLAAYLQAMGAQISGAGTSQIQIEGTSELQPVARYQTIGDRIEAGTFLVAGALSGGPLTVSGVNPEHLTTALLKLRQMGVTVKTAANSITVSRQRPLLATDVQTLPYPGFPTDLQAQYTLLDALAAGSSIVAENIFENRFQYADELVRMGANIQIRGHFAHIRGVPSLSGAPVQAPDLRGGAALVLAGLQADGETRVTNTLHIDRG